MLQGIYIMGIIQGMILFLILIFKRSQSKEANRWLALLILATTLSILGQYFSDYRLQGQLPALFLLLTGTPFLLGPLLFIFTRSKYNSERKYSNTLTGLHFIPFLIYLIFIAWIFGSGEFKSLSEFTLKVTEVPDPENYRISTIGIAKAFHLFIYTVLSGILFYRDFRVKQNVDLQGVIIVIFVIFQVTMWVLIFVRSTIVDSVFSTMMVAYLYLVGYLGLTNSEVLRLNKGAKYKSSDLTKSEGKLLYESLLKLMAEEKPFLDNELSLKKLSVQLNINENKLSQVINQNSGMNYSEFVNQYRVEEFKKLVKLPEFQHLNILAIAFEAGFNNKNSFNKAFRKFTGMTPSSYHRNLDSTSEK